MSSTINCKYLRCAQEYLSRTKSSNDNNCCVRIQHCKPIDKEGETLTTPKYNNDDIQHLDKVQRRKEKKRRKKELRNKMKEELAMQIQSIRVTTTVFPPLSTCTLEQSIVQVKPLIVLDLNGILCHRIRDKNILNTKSSSMYRPSLGSISKTEVIPRSDLHEFLSLLNNNFSLAVWTSATRKTARMLVQLLFPEEIRDRLVFVWHRNFCNLVETSENTSSSTEEKQPIETSEECNTPPSRKRRRRGNESRIDKLLCSPVNDNDDEDDDNTDKLDRSATKCVKRKASANKEICHSDVTAIKSLSKVWSAYPLWDETNTILLDDSREKCPTKHSANALHPLSIRGTITACNNEDSVIEKDVKSKDSYSIIDDDETNQKSQFAFFELLAKHWSKSTSPPVDMLMCFLKEHANKHNMGWEMGSANAKV